MKYVATVLQGNNTPGRILFFHELMLCVIYHDGIINLERKPLFPRRNILIHFNNLFQIFITGERAFIFRWTNLFCIYLQFKMIRFLNALLTNIYNKLPYSIKDLFTCMKKNVVNKEMLLYIWWIFSPVWCPGQNKSTSPFLPWMS
jgi:hypothetical protein